MRTFCVNILVLILEAYATQYSDYTTLLMLSSAEGQDPYDVWQNTGSSYDSATNLSVSNLAASNTAGYRNTLIDSWASDPPDLIRVCYRNDLAYSLFCMTFNSTGSTSLDWLTSSKMTSSTDSTSCDNTRDTFTSYSSSYPCSDSSTGVKRYYATSVKLSGSNVVYVVATKTTPLILPVQTVLDSVSCFISYGGSLHPFVYNATVTGLYRLHCSAVCRENNHPFGALHFTTCSCISAEPPAGGSMTSCNQPCDGAPSELCGGTDGGIPADAILFNYVKTDVDVSQFDTPEIQYSSVALTSSIQVTFTSVCYLSGFIVEVGGSPSFPVSITMSMRYVTGACSDEEFNETPLTTTTFSVTDGSPVSIALTVTRVKCVRISIAVTDMGGSDVTVSVTLTPKVYADDIFVTAKYISIEAAWELNETCPCDCRVYNLLYGRNSYENMTYEEIEVALQNVTQQIIKELSVNVSGLSSTIRSKTSAGDDRQSAAAVGYALGVVLLTVTFGGLFLSDVTRLFSSMHMLKDNILSRFNKDSGSAESETEGPGYSTLGTSTPESGR